MFPRADRAGIGATTLACALLAAMAVPSARQQPAAPDGWKLAWSDEFDRPGLPDPARWSYDVGGHGWGNRELQFYTRNRRENARVEDGHLVIEARREEWEGMHYTSARLVTKGKGDWTYGRIEVRAKLPVGRGSWPAIWTLGSTTPLRWPDDGEIDIMEHVGFDPGVIHASVHTQGASTTSPGRRRRRASTVPDAQGAFHVYATEWDRDRIRTFVDDREYFTFARRPARQETPGRSTRRSTCCSTSPSAATGAGSRGSTTARCRTGSRWTTCAIYERGRRAPLTPERCVERLASGRRSGTIGSSRARRARCRPMPRLVASPTIIEAAGNKPKVIEEYAGRVNSGHAGVSVARMVSPEGWEEPGQRPEFEEITVVLRGMLRVEHEQGSARRARRPGGGRRPGRVGALQQPGAGRRRVRGHLPAGVLAGHRASRAN